MFESKVTTAVASELLTAADIKDAMRITFTDDDTLLGDLIKAARQAIEKHCSISIGTQTITSTLDLNGWEEIELPFGPVQSITTVTYKSDFATYSAAIASEDYDTDGVDYLTFTPFTSGRWKIVYQTGYSTLPDDLKSFWIRLVTFYYENRGDSGKIPDYLQKELINYKRLVWL